MEAAKQGPPCLCKQKCFEKFTETELSRIFTCFWQLGDKNIQDAYLHGLIRVRQIERHRPRRSHYTPRSVKFVYVVRFALLCFFPFLLSFCGPQGHPFDCFPCEGHPFDCFPHGKLLGVVRNRSQQKFRKITACNLHRNWVLKLKYMYIPKVLQEPLKTSVYGTSKSATITE